MTFDALLSQQTHSFSSPALRQITLEVQKVGGINLGQGVCNRPPPDYILEQAEIAAKEGVNRYTNPRGLIELREALARKLAHFNDLHVDPEIQVLATCGATGAFEAVCGVLLNPGDEVIVFEPSYPYHIQALKRYQANIKFIPLEAPHWAIDFDRVREALSPRTKFILINTPGNPTGKVFTRDEMEQIGRIIEPTNCLCVTDEIYEYMTFAGRKHLSPASLPILANRTITMGGYSKTFSITGWRIGYAVVPPALSGPMASFLDAVYVCPPAPLQRAVADGIARFDDSFYRDLGAKYESKRDRFVSGLRAIGLDPLVPQGAYYLICGYAQKFGDIEAGEFVARMIAETGVGAVPSSDFVRDPSSAHWVRFCLAQEDAVLDAALDRLARL